MSDTVAILGRCGPLWHHAGNGPPAKPGVRSLSGLAVVHFAAEDPIDTNRVGGVGRIEFGDCRAARRGPGHNVVARQARENRDANRESPIERAHGSCTCHGERASNDNNFFFMLSSATAPPGHAWYACLPSAGALLVPLDCAPYPPLKFDRDT